MRTKLTALLVPLTFSLALVIFAGIQNDSKGSASYKQDKNMTLTGCLRAGSETNTYMLDNVSVSQSLSSRAPSEMARTESSYKLIPEGRVDLKDHVGHKVEVTATPMQKESSMENSESGEYSTSTSGNSVPELRVSSIRHVSTTCP